MLKIQKARILSFCLLILILFFIPGIGQAEKLKKYNIVLITCDALRSDHLSAYGYQRKTSPNIDKLAEESVLFEQAIAQGPHTLLSVPSLVTSTYPHTHGVVDYERVIPPYLPVFYNILKEEGYKTLLFTSQLYFLYAIRAFSSLDVLYYENKNEKLITDEVIRYLKKGAVKEQPFFLWVYFLKPHFPYASPNPYNTMYKNDKFYNSYKHIPIGATNDGMNTIPIEVAEKGITEVDYYIAQYDGAIRYVDSQIGEILNVLKNTGLYDNTLIVFFADHGESLGEHNFYFCHATSLYEELIKVPLIFHFPDKIGIKAKLTLPVQLIDIAPTILDFLGIERPKTFRGNSLLPWILDKEKREKLSADSMQESQKLVAVSELNYGEEDFEIAVRTGHWKLIYTKGDVMEVSSYELYNLKSDPLEVNNLVLREKDIFLKLRQQVISLKEEAQRYNNERKKDPSQNSKKEYEKELIRKKIAINKSLASENMRELLRSLGYLQ